MPTGEIYDSHIRTFLLGLKWLIYSSYLGLRHLQAEEVRSDPFLGKNQDLITQLKELGNVRRDIHERTFHVTNGVQLRRIGCGDEQTALSAFPVGSGSV